MDAWIVLPVKPLSEGKSRLAALLTPQQRYDLNLFLFQRLLALVQPMVPQQLLVVSRCDRVLSLAKDAAGYALKETGHDLNSALFEATAWLKERNAHHMLIIPTDLPQIMKEDVGSLIPASANHLLIARDRSKRGTNALFCPVQTAFQYKFGVDSCEKHAHQAINLGLKVVFRDNSRVAFDLDTPSDYAEWNQYATQLQGI